jgi:hypothetical protein
MQDRDEAVAARGVPGVSDPKGGGDIMAAGGFLLGKNARDSVRVF